MTSNLNLGAMAEIKAFINVDLDGKLHGLFFGQAK
jgi:hypothetical protein